MGRLLVSLLLTANLLVCPLRCGFCKAAEQAAEDEAPAACCCCAQERDLPAPVEPADDPADDPAEQCDCQDCICEGATLQHAPERPEATTDAAFLVAFPVLQCVGNKFHAAAEPSDRSIVLGGRGMRIAHQSLLN